MSEAVMKGLYDALTSDATLAGMLSTYKDKPAVFTTPLIPREFKDSDPKRPYVVASEIQETGGNLTLGGGDFETSRVIDVFDVAEGSALEVATVASYIRGLLQTDLLPMDGLRVMHRVVTGPVSLDLQPDEVYRQRVVARLTIEEI